MVDTTQSSFFSWSRLSLNSTSKGIYTGHSWTRNFLRPNGLGLLGRTGLLDQAGLDGLSLLDQGYYQILNLDSDLFYLFSSNLIQIHRFLHNP